MAFLTYQITYWAWLKVEHEEERHRKTEEVKGLEEDIKKVQGKRLLEEK